MTETSSFQPTKPVTLREMADAISKFNEVKRPMTEMFCGPDLSRIERELLNAFPDMTTKRDGFLVGGIQIMSNAHVPENELWVCTDGIVTHKFTF